MMKVPLLDLQAQYATIRTEIRDVIDRVCESQHFILGPEVQALEESYRDVLWGPICHRRVVRDRCPPSRPDGSGGRSG